MLEASEQQRRIALEIYYSLSTSHLRLETKLEAAERERDSLKEQIAELLIVRHLDPALEGSAALRALLSYEAALGAHEANDRLARLRECLEPGKAPAILNAMFMEAERLGFYQSTAKHALTQFGEEVERLRRLLAEREVLLRECVEPLHRLKQHYISLVASGDCGDWDAQKEEPVIAANAAIARAEAALNPNPKETA